MPDPQTPRLRLRTWLSTSALLLFPWRLYSQSSTGAQFLRIGTGARPAAMGEAYTALSQDVNALYYNPAGLSGLTRRELGATHTQWLQDSQFDFIGYAQPTSLGVLGVGLTRLANGVPDARDANRQASGGFSSQDMAYTLGFSRPVLPQTSMGFNVKYLESRIAGYSASTFAMDIGAIHQFRERPLSLGMSVLNIGKGMTFVSQTDPLPLTVAVGGAYRLAGTLQIAVDVAREVNDKRFDVRVGTEYGLLPSFSLRAGYNSQLTQTGGTGGSSLSALSGLGTGFGLKLSNYNLDYTFTPFGELGNVQRISLGARF